MTRKKKSKEERLVSKAVDPVMEVMLCTDNAELLVQKHLDLGVDVLHAVVTMTFASLYMAMQQGEDADVYCDSGAIDYLKRATKILGMHDVSAALEVDLETAMDAFRDAPVGLEESVKKNAKAMDLLMS